MNHFAARLTIGGGGGSGGGGGRGAVTLSDDREGGYVASETVDTDR